MCRRVLRDCICIAEAEKRKPVLKEEAGKRGKSKFEQESRKRKDNGRSGRGNGEVAFNVAGYGSV